MHRVPLSSHQWNDQEIIENLSYILNCDRESDVAGNFVRYGMFSFRNEQIEKLQGKIPNIKLLENSKEYFQKDSFDRLKEWTSFKCQWIIPTLNDISTRIFDALITGSLIIIPERFRHDECLSNLHPDDYECYSDDDIEDPMLIRQKALEKYDKWGVTGIHRRVNFGMTNNLDKRIIEIKKFIENKYMY